MDLHQTKLHVDSINREKEAKINKQKERIDKRSELANKTSTGAVHINPNKYGEGWDRIFGQKKS